MRPTKPRTRLRTLAVTVALTIVAAACGSWGATSGAAPAVGVPIAAPAPAGARWYGPSTWWRTAGPSGAWMTMEKHDAPGPGLHPTVVIFPGTSGLSVEQQLLAQLFAARGFTGVAVCWFRTGPSSAGVDCPNGPAPLGVSAQMLPDMDALLAAVKRLPGVDPNRVALYGGSRGGGMVALMATQGGPEPVVSVSGLMDPATFPTLPSETNVITRASAIRAPVFLAYGVDDGFVNWRTNTIPLADAITAAGVAPAPVVRGYAGGHSPDFFSIGDWFPTAPEAPHVLDDVVGFLKRTLTVGVAVAARPGGGAYELYGNGQVVALGGAPDLGVSTPIWPGWDIARDLAVMPDGQGYVVLDGFGGLHRFGTATSLPATAGVYWPGWDIARAVAITPSGNGVVVLDGFGGLHGAGDAPALTQTDAYWPGWDIARDVAITPDGAGVVVLDGRGGVHRAGTATATVPSGTPGGHADVARALALTPSGAGYGVVTTSGMYVAGDAPAAAPLPAGDWRGLALTTGGWLAVRGDRTLAP